MRTPAQIPVLILLAALAMAGEATPSVHVNFADETVGARPVAVAPLVGEWQIAADGDQKKVLRVDGAHWQHDHLPATLAAAGTTLFADRGPAFAQRIQARPDYPLAALPMVTDFHGGTISVHFKPIAGSDDQAAGIAFGLDATGDYFLVRANALENNIGFFRVVDGSRKTIKWVENTPTPGNQWHTLSITVAGSSLAVSLDGTSYMHEALPSPVAGKVALWSKSDSVVLFDDITVSGSKP